MGMETDYKHSESNFSDTVKPLCDCSYWLSSQNPHTLNLFVPTSAVPSGLTSLLLHPGDHVPVLGGAGKVEEPSGLTEDF
jgi:hypothetical protein